MELTLKEGCCIEFYMATAALEHVVLLRVQLTADDVGRYYTRWRLEGVRSVGHLWHGLRLKERLSSVEVSRSKRDLAVTSLRFSRRNIKNESDSHSIQQSEGIAGNDAGLANRWKTGSQKDHRKTQAAKQLAVVLGRRGGGAWKVRQLCGERRLQNRNSGPYARVQRRRTCWEDRH